MRELFLEPDTALWEKRCKEGDSTTNHGFRFEVYDTNPESRFRNGFVGSTWRRTLSDAERAVSKIQAEAKEAGVETAVAGPSVSFVEIRRPASVEEIATKVGEVR